jgi:membrane protease YdiL (CAAX protease family)
LVEEIVFRVALASALAVVAGPIVAIGVSAVAFGAIHVVFGESVAERASAVVNATLFGVVLGAVWLATRDVVAITAFHAVYNVVGGMFLGWVGIDSIESTDPVPSWPFVVERTRTRAGAVLFTALTVSECIPLALVLVAVLNLRSIA